MIVLAFESSCDETSVAICSFEGEEKKILSNKIATQVAIHALYGGVVPEIAGRAHIEAISNLTYAAFDEAGVTVEDIDLVAVTSEPGLIGALLVAVNYAKAFAFAHGIELVGVNHIRGHIAATDFEYPDLKAPFFAMVASGGHTSLIDVKSPTDFVTVGRTRDDAIGEAFDKVARVLGMPYPGGAALDRAAKQGDETKYSLPRSKPGENPYNMSFSGLKTAALNLIHHAQQVHEELDIPSLCAAFSSAVSDTLVPRVVMALEQTGYRKIAVAGGVAANSRIRADILAAADKLGAEVYMPPLSLCGDNAAMIGAQAYYEYQAGNVADMGLNAYATKSILGEAL